MKRIALLVIFAVCFSTGQGYCSAEWPNEPAGSTNVFDCPFAGNVCGMQDVYKSTVFVTDPATPTGGTNQVLDNYLGVNSVYGNAQQVLYLPNKPREIYVGTWWKTNPEFQGNNNIANKLIFISGDAGNNNYLNWYGSSDAPRQLSWVNQSPQNNCHVSGWYGECADGVRQSTGSFAPNGATNGVIAAGSGWHRIEIYQKSSTTGTSRDGIVRIWVDGILETNYTNVNLTPEGFSNVQYNHTWDGGYTCAVRDCSRAWHHYWDHLRVSVPNGAPEVVTIMIGPSTLPPARTGSPYLATLAANGGKAPFHWFLDSGNLPAGLTFNANTGVISGSPTTVGKSSFGIRVTDSSQPAATATKIFSIVTSGTSGIGDGRDIPVSRGKMEYSNGNLVLSGSSYPPGVYSLAVYNLSGKRILAQKGARYPGEGIEIGTLNNGVYVVDLKRGTANSVFRFQVVN